VCVCVRAWAGLGARLCLCFQALVARPEVAAELRLAGNGDAELLDARAVVCSFLEQEYNDSGAYPRLAFKVARLGHAKMLHWMLEQVKRQRAEGFEWHLARALKEAPGQTPTPITTTACFAPIRALFGGT